MASLPGRRGRVGKFWGYATRARSANFPWITGFDREPSPLFLNQFSRSDHVVTVNVPALVAVPPGVTTVILPVFAPEGMVTVIFV